MRAHSIRTNKWYVAMMSMNARIVFEYISFAFDWNLSNSSYHAVSIKHLIRFCIQTQRHCASLRAALEIQKTWNFTLEIDLKSFWFLIFWWLNWMYSCGIGVFHMQARYYSPQINCWNSGKKCRNSENAHEIFMQFFKKSFIFREMAISPLKIIFPSNSILLL